MTKRYRRLWDAVRKIIKENYSLMKDVRIRDAYYIIGDLVAPLIGTEITKEDYNWLLTQQGYNSLRDDIWTSLEQKEGLERPAAWPDGIVIDQGIIKPLLELERDLKRGVEYIWDQARGFLFVEKRGVAERLQPLSEYGWTIFAGRGYPLRLIRRLLKEEEQKRPVLALHDFDRDGKGIYRALGFETRRTRHLDIALGERVTDLGLIEDQVNKLNLPRRPSPPKYKGRLRTELSGLAVLRKRMGIENYYLAFVVAAMILKGVTLSPQEVEKLDMMKRHIRWGLTSGLRGIVKEALEEIIEEIEDEDKFQGTAVKGELEDMEILAPGLKEKLVESGLTQARKTHWVYEDDMDEEARELTDEKLLDLLRE